MIYLYRTRSCNLQSPLESDWTWSNSKNQFCPLSPTAGIEPATTWLRVMRSTIWARRASHHMGFEPTTARDHWILTGVVAFWYCPQVQSNYHVEPTATTAHHWLWILVSHGEVWRFRRRSLYMGIEPKYQQLQSKSNGDLGREPGFRSRDQPNPVTFQWWILLSGSSQNNLKSYRIYYPLKSDWSYMCGTGSNPILNPMILTGYGDTMFRR